MGKEKLTINLVPRKREETEVIDSDTIERRVRFARSSIRNCRIMLTAGALGLATVTTAGTYIGSKIVDLVQNTDETNLPFVLGIGLSTAAVAAYCAYKDNYTVNTLAQRIQKSKELLRSYGPQVPDSKRTRD